MTDTEYGGPREGWQADGSLAFDANYGRDGVVCVTDTVCLGCGKADLCVHVDQSEGEYNPASICRDCIAKLFERHRTFNDGGA